MEADWAILLRPTVRQILETLLSGPRSLTEMAARTDLTKPALQRHLKDLERLGVVARTYRPVGLSREVVYTLEGCSLHLELRPSAPDDPAGGTALSWASAGREDAEFPLAAQIPKPSDRADVVNVLRALREGTATAWPSLFLVLFGSIVKGESTKKSDIDLLVVLPGANRKFQEGVAGILADAQEAATLPIQPFFTTRESFLAARTRIDAVAAREGVVLHGDPRERDLWNRMTRYRTISI